MRIVCVYVGVNTYWISLHGNENENENGNENENAWRVARARHFECWSKKRSNTRDYIDQYQPT